MPLVLAPLFRGAVQREAGGQATHGKPNLRCPRNGKQTVVVRDVSGAAARFLSRPLAQASSWEGRGRSHLPARIPANTVASLRGLL